jgi:septal ring factor EnvC (AmiA/AmiB activator)
MLNFKKNQHLHYVTFLLVALSAIFFTHSVFANQNELSGVKNEIDRQKQSLSKQQKQLNALQKSLRDQELTISLAENDIKRSSTDLAVASKNIDELHQQVDSLQTQKHQQQKILADLVHAYYVMTTNSANRNLFSNDEKEDRVSQYYQHLAKARANAITELEQTKQQLEQSERALELERNQIAQLLKEQKAKREKLTKNQTSRKSTIKKINKSISGDKNYLAELQRNETRLKAEIAKAAKRNTVPMDGLARQKGKLPWPLKGQVMHRFGTKQTGQITWKGMVIKAQYGQSVKAVYSGTVVFAEYLRGYGLVVLLDHGKGDMTLYGYNQTLLKKEGDRVRAGETLALAGDTGGQSSSSLYFEIRRNSKAQNPKQWLTR